MKYFFCFFIFCSFSDAFSCPLGKHETELTFARVMRNLGRFSLEGESICQKGKDFPRDISNEKIDKAISDFNIVLECTNAVLNNLNPPLLPSKYADLLPEERQSYLARFVSSLEEFKIAALHFQGLIVKEKNTLKESRNFLTCSDFTKDYNEIINRAHRDL